MDREYRSGTSRAGPSEERALKRRRIETFAPETAHERHQRLFRLKQSYERGRVPPKPQSKHELEILKERHQFVRDSDVDPATLTWEDQLAYKYYETLFKEFAVVNLKHYKTGAVALRWRTEDEVLSGIGHLTCGSLRCRYHEPSPSILASLEDEADVPPDPESTAPLVETTLEELEMPFGYVEGGVKKTTLVKVVLCRECAKKLRYGRKKAKEEREKMALMTTGEAGGATREADGRQHEKSDRSRRRDGEGRDRSRRREGEEWSRRRSGSSEPDDAGPALPPDLQDERRRRHKSRDERDGDSARRSRRRSASPRRRQSP